ncbi:MAG TPA: hypothetical protein VHG51_11570 [Longimicrobiaceae bacterium]|nr:hypothetical protein [Longimicrobiaceae bacterium]
MSKFPVLAALALLAAGSPLAAQVRTASIGVSARVAEPLRVEAPTEVELEYSRGRYLDVTTPASLAGAAGYLVDVVVTRAPAEDGGTAGAAPAPPASTRLAGGRERHRIDLRDSAPADAVRITYVVATDL